MATYTTNYNLEKPDSTDDFKDFRASYNGNMDIIDQNLGGGGGGGGHTIVDPDGTSMPQENKLQFTGAVNVSDDSVNGQTVVDVEGGGNYYLNTLYSTEEKKIGYWTDGKPLYQKAIELTNLNVIYTETDTYTNIDVSALSIDTMVDMCGWIERSWGTGSRIYNWGYYEKTSTYTIHSNIRWNKTGNAIQYTNTVPSGNTVPTALILIQYTKTTDTPELNPQTGGVIYLPTIYSEEEREVGVWRDGKPLYQKTIHVDSGWTVGSWSAIANVSSLNIETLVKTTGRFNRVSLQSTFEGSTRPENNDTNSLLSVRFYNGNIELLVKTYTNVSKVDVTIQYTKTTDTAGSGTWTPSGAKAVHYSTNEQVIGTWIDGKPIYEITKTGLSLTIPYNSWVNSGIDATTIDTIINAIVYDNNGTCFNTIMANTAGAGTVHTTFGFQSGRNGTNIIATKIVLQYTKTTD